MTNTLPRPIQFWHPLKGGWRTGTLIKLGRKWATVTYITGRPKRLPLDAIKEVENSK